MEISDYNNSLNILDKQIKNTLAHFITAIPVEVVAVNIKNQTVDVLPMVHMVDHTGKSHKHSIIHNVPFIRIQGGNYGIICDPQIGDKGEPGYHPGWTWNCRCWMEPKFDQLSPSTPS